MKITSDSYRQDMQSGFRNIWQPSLRLGLVNEFIQSYNRVIMVDYEGVFLESDLDLVTQLGVNRYSVSTFEHNTTLADGNSLFIDDNYTYSKVWAGIVSRQCDYLQVRLEHSNFTQKTDPVDMTLAFVDNAPKKVIVRILDSYGLGGDVIGTYYGTNNNPEQMFIVVEGVVIDSTKLTVKDKFYIDIQVVETHEPTKLVKLVEIGMGTFIEFSHDEILSNSGSISESSHIISLDLPQTSMSITINNEGNKYTSSVFDKLRKGQNGALTISYTAFDGTVDNIKYPMLQLDDFSVTDKDMTLKFVDYLRYETQEVTTVKNTGVTPNLNYYMSSVYNKFYTPGFKVVYDEGVGQQDISMYFGNDDTKRPAKDFIKLLSGFCACTMRNEGKSVVIDSIPDSREVNTLDVESTTALQGSKPKGFVLAYPYSTALWEKDRVKADGSSSFLSNPDQMYISQEISDEYGHFVNDIKVKVTNVKYEDDNIILNFNPKSIPRTITIETHWIEEFPWGDEDHVGDTIIITNNTNSELVIRRELHDFDYAYVTLNDLTEGNRRLEAYGFNVDRQMYTLSGELMYKQPTQTPEELVRNITVNEYRNDGSGGLDLGGQKVIECNTTGVDVLYDHSIVVGSSATNSIGKTLYDYYTNNVVYTVDFVGDPSLEVSDIVQIETYKGKINLELEEVTTTFSNGGISGTIKGKEIKYG